MRQLSRFLWIGAAVLTMFVVLGAAGNGAAPYAHAMQATGTESPSELPADTKALSFDKPVIEVLDPNTSIKFYTFKGTANQLVSVTVEPTTGAFYTTITIMTDDLQKVLGGAQGENLVSGSLVVKLPADGEYAVSVAYDPDLSVTPSPGSFQIKVSDYKTKVR